MPFYQKRPVVVEALLFDGSQESANGIAAWMGMPLGPILKPLVLDGFAMVIPTKEGDMRANPGDYVIKGVIGEFYPCKPEVFHATYEPCNEVEAEKARFERGDTVHDVRNLLAEHEELEGQEVPRG